jgi:uncharacterized protein (TIGR03086 family)
MDPIEMHRRAQAEFARVLGLVTDDDLDAPTPCAAWSVHDLIDHVIVGNRAVADRMGGDSTDDSTADAADADLVGGFRASSDLANGAFAAPGALDGTVELPFGEVPSSVWAAIRSGDLYAHAWDLAVAIGADRDLDPALGEAISAVTAPMLPPGFRGDDGPFGPERACPPNSSVADRYAAFLGREVPV